MSFSSAAQTFQPIIKAAWYKWGKFILGPSIQRFAELRMELFSVLSSGPSASSRSSVRMLMSEASVEISNDGK